MAAVGQAAAGGYEAANRRNVEALTRRGVRVIELPYPKSTLRPALKWLSYAHRLVRAAVFVVGRRDAYDVLHLTPLNLRFALAETLLISCARLAGRPVLMDVRAGTFTRRHATGSGLYRWTIDRSLRLASGVAVEGEAYLPFVRSRTASPAFLFPNYVSTPALQATPVTTVSALSGPVRLLYFGRLVAEKGMEVMLDVLVLLRARGHEVELELIGDGPPGAVAEWRARYAGSPVTWTPSLPLAAILQRAAQAHFFMFPSRHDGEGHSNSLNEAMSVGLVPICSDQGFSRSVVGGAGVVLPVGASANAYADALAQVLDAGQWQALSQRARTRVREHFSESVTLPALIEAYQRMLRPRR